MKEKFYFSIGLVIFLAGVSLLEKEFSWYWVPGVVMVFSPVVMLVKKVKKNNYNNNKSLV